MTKRGDVQDPADFRLAKALGITPVDAKGLRARLLVWEREFCRDGLIPADPDEMAYSVSFKPGEDGAGSELVRGLIAYGYCEAFEGEVRVCGWQARKDQRDARAAAARDRRAAAKRDRSVAERNSDVAEHRNSDVAEPVAEHVAEQRSGESPAADSPSLPPPIIPQTASTPPGAPATGQPSAGHPADDVPAGFDFDTWIHETTQHRRWPLLDPVQKAEFFGYWRDGVSLDYIARIVGEAADAGQRAMRWVRPALQREALRVRTWSACEKTGRAPPEVESPPIRIDQFRTKES